MLVSKGNLIWVNAIRRQSQKFSTCKVTCFDGEWRKSLGLSENPNANGALTDLPDFTYLDGRPTPPGRNLMKRREKHRELTRNIIEMSKQMDEIGIMNRNKELAAKEAKLLEERSLLKPKGNALRKK
ncbi:large ribosomal subunit protein mL52-like [Artemia franciscana]|uniref:Large ribosomal subunit protein mL52 n=1 Tax=Artemia franciscana TaxID=6661 RepID=A0AA88I7N6_ARTSF|nr:hypothetical protein QYM36_003193 [Artemia franciscana]